MQTTTIASWAATIWRALEARGIQPEPVFLRAGINPGHLQEAGQRLPLSAMTRLWELAIDITADPCFGIVAGQHVHPTTFHALGYAWLASHTLREALDRFVRYTRLVSTALSLRTVTAGGEVELYFENISIEPTSLAAVDAGIAALITLCRSSYGNSFMPQRVQMSRPELPCHAAFTDWVGAPTVFGAANTVVVFDSAALNVALPTGNAELARAADEVILKYLARFDREDVVTQARTLLLELLPSGKTSARHVADALHLSVRNLQRKLAEHGTSIARLIEEARRDLASQYVRESHLSIGEITYLLGFSEPASFTRAFRRWYGVTPSASRKLTSVKDHPAG